MYISPSGHQTETSNDSENITMDGQILQFTHVEKLLGVYVDHTLSWKSQVEHTLKKMQFLTLFANENQMLSQYPGKKIILQFIHTPSSGLLLYNMGKLFSTSS